MRIAVIGAGAGAGTASMQRDIREGRPSELESQNGAVVWLGSEVGVPTPVNLEIYDRLRQLERRNRERASEAGSG